MRISDWSSDVCSSDLTRMAELFRAMSGPKQDVQPTLGFSATDELRINRQLRLLIDEGRRGIADASLGSANLIFLTPKMLDLRRIIDADRRDHSLLAITRQLVVSGTSV